VAAFERAIDLYRRMGDVSVPGILLVELGNELARMGRIEQAATVLAEAFPVLERAGAPKALAQYFLALGVMKMMTGDLTAARIHYERALSLCRSAGAERSLLGGLIYLADATWATGDLDTALAGFREAAALMRQFPMIPKGSLGMCLTNLAGIHTERMELDEALAAAREGLPLRQEAGFSWSALDHLALRAALAGKVANAACLSGYADAAFAAKQSSRQPNEAHAHDRLQALLRQRLDPDELERLLAEGAKMSEDEACRLALED
jgi:tetratricopeptide (TPR) repeat protein